MPKSGAIAVDFLIKEGKDGLKSLTLDANGLKKAMESVLKVSDDTQRRLVSFAATATGLYAANQAANQLANTLTLLTSESQTFSKAMKAANTMAGKGSQDFKKMKGEVAELAKTIPIARDELANGLYQTISNGVPENNWMEFLNRSARSAIGGMADINKVVGVTATVIKNYGLEWEAAGDIQDKIQLTAKNGVTSFEQLAQALPRVTGNAATLGVTVNELLATFATLTGVSGNTAEVSTQLAAIFTALVKPSTEASKMASAMGIQFDAAAIKAAGGFDKFLQNLQQSVSAYATASGKLEQEVYGKLFGSAESLKALIPLQGELADKFSENISTMVDSAGTMDAAFKDMSSTEEAHNQILKNKIAALTDVAAGFISTISPTVLLVNSTLGIIVNIMTLTKAFKGLAVVQNATSVKTFAANVAIKTIGATSKKAALGLEMLAATEGRAAAQATALKMALSGILKLGGIGIALWAITAAIEYFTGASEKAADVSEELKVGEEEYTQAAAQAKISIDNEISSLKELIDSNKDATDAVNHLNSEYGDIFGNHKTAAEWYDTLTTKSRNYVKQLGFEARAKAIMPKLAEAIIEKDEAADEMRKLEEEGKDQKTITISRYSTVDMQYHDSTYTVETDEYRAARGRKEAAEVTETALQAQLDATTVAAKKNAEVLNDGQAGYNRQLKVTEMNLDQVGDAVTDTEAKLRSTIDPSKIKDLKAYNAQLAARKKYLEQKTGLGSKSSTGRTLVKDPKTDKELSNNISIYKEKVTGEDTEEQRAILAQIKNWEDMRKVIQDVYDEMERPAEIKCLEDFDKELNYLRKKRSKASGEDLAELDAQIESVEDMRSEYERQGHVEIPIDQIKTYRQLNKELDYYNSLLETAEGAAREAIQGTINNLNDLKNAWDEALKKKPEDISKLNTIEQLGDAITYYQHKQSQATGEERYNLGLTIAGLEKKRNALSRVTDIIKSQQEVEELNSLSDRELKVKIKSIGFDGFTERIRELNAQLNDVENPVTEQERERIQGLIDTYDELRRKSIDTFEVFKDGYGNIKSIGNGIESLTEALEGNGNAWQTLTDIVDAFIQIFEGIQAIVGIVNMLTEATKAHSLAKKEETQSTVENTAATIAETAASGANIVVKEAESIANATESGSKLPFPMNSVAIAAGVAAVVGALAIIGGFATGGIVPGNSPSGDKLLARVNSGEMILNKSQQSRLFRMLNAPVMTMPDVALPGAISAAIRVHDWDSVMGGVRANLRPAGEPVVVGGTLRASGRDLVCVLSNETRIASKSGRYTNIKI